MRCHGGFALEEAKRRSWYNPEAILQDLDQGMTFVDVGCGDGFFSLLAAKKVGDNGKVYAVDIDASAIEKLKNHAKAEGIGNIDAKVGSAEYTVFCVGCADMVFFSMNLHDFDDPAKVLSNALKMVKSTGCLIDLDWKKQQMAFGPPFSIRFSEEKVCELLKNAGFKVDSMVDVGPYHYVVTAKPAE
jgi:ubiquinone/menaquinone biosynthesis C-methylase UbiE